MRAVRSLAAAVAIMAWTPGAQAGGSFSFSIEGGDHYGYGHFQNRHYGNHHGYRHGYRPRGYFFGPRYYPGYRGYRHPRWRHEGSRRGYRHYRGPGPRCIYRYNRWYCR